jgi:molybdate transport system ATP-binding protein
VGPALEAHLAVTMGSFSLEASLTVHPGEVLVLLGPNGSGKTTCLDLLAGLRAPDRGLVTLDGVALCDTERGIDLAPDERRVGLVFQDFALFPHRTVRGNVAYGPRARGEARDAAARTVAEWLSRLDLDALAERPVGNLSGGQKQRVAIARALASGARILLLDEPFASLDATMRASVRAELRVFLRSVGCPAVLVTHDPLDAFVMADRIAVLEAGRVAQEGTGEELLAHPRTPFVAELVGLNFYQAELEPGSGLKEARVGGVTFHVLADALAGAVHLAFAPSDVALFQEESSGSFQNTFPARVRETRSLPDRVRVILDAGVVIAADITREAGRRLQLERDSPLNAMIKATSIHVYP